MKALILLIAFALPALAQTVTLPPASSSTVTLNWSAPVACTTSAPCNYQAYRITGSCPATLAGSSGWTVFTATADNVTTYTDATVSAGVNYSYVVEAEQSGVNSGPSNCITVAIPNPLQPPTSLTGQAP